MSDRMVIALDAMGGDFGPGVAVPAAAMAMEENSKLKFIFTGDEKAIRDVLADFPELSRASEIIHTDIMVGNDEKPSNALRNGRNSSMRFALNAVAEGKAGAAVSGGNTGALMAMAKFVFKSLPGIHRPAIASRFPTLKDDTVVLDLGANVEGDAENLVQFAILGAVYTKMKKGLDTKPSVGLLNVGTEDMKGKSSVRSAASILKSMDFPGSYYGYVEGNDIPLGTVDVVVTDGFTGNVALKVTEGMGKLASHFIKDTFNSSILARIGGFFALLALKKLKKRVDPRYYNGGMFLGLNGICVKSHGGSDAYGFSRAILMAAEMVEGDYVARVAEEISNFSGGEEPAFSREKLAKAVS